MQVGNRPGKQSQLCNGSFLGAWAGALGSISAVCRTRRWVSSTWRGARGQCCRQLRCPGLDVPFFGCHWEDEALCWLGYDSLTSGFTATVVTFYSFSTVKTIQLSHACRLIREMHGDNFSTTYKTLGKELAFVTEKHVSFTSIPMYLPSPPVSLWHSLSQPAQGVWLRSVPGRAGTVVFQSPHHLQPPAPGPPQLCSLLAAAQ